MTDVERDRRALRASNHDRLREEIQHRYQLNDKESRELILQPSRTIPPTSPRSTAT